MKKVVLIVMMLLLFSSSVIASTPTFSLTKLLDNNVVNGNVSVGNLLFVKEDYVPEDFVLTSVVSGTYQRFDRLIWSSGSSAKITNPIGVETVLVTGSTYSLSSSGVYTLASFLNSSNSASLIVQPEQDMVIDLAVVSEPEGMSFTFSDNNFVLVSEDSVSVDVVIDDDVSPGSFVFDYLINNVSHTLGFEVLEVVNWSVENDFLEQDVVLKNGDSVYLGRLEIDNLGNVPVEISVVKEDEFGYLLGVPSTQTLFKSGELVVNFQAQIPMTLPSGDYVVGVDVVGGGLSEKVFFNLSVVDSIVPVIESINFTSDNVAVDNLLTVVATDNNFVSNLSLRFDGKEYFFSRDGNLFSRSFVFDKVSVYNFEFCAFDSDDNVNCLGLNKSFSKLVVLNNFSRVLSLPSVKVGRFSSGLLFTMSSRVDEGVSIQLLDIVGDNQFNSTPLVRVVSGLGSIKQFSEFQNEVIVYDEGDYFLEVRENVIEDFTGSLRVGVPDYVEEVQDITFNVGFKSYDVPLDFSVPWVDGKDFVCSVVDTGDLDTSKYNCVIEYPISIKPGDISIPTTVGERERFKSEADLVRGDLEDVRLRNTLVVTFLLFIVIFATGYFLYMFYIYPYARVKRRIRE